MNLKPSRFFPATIITLTIIAAVFTYTNLKNPNILKIKEAKAQNTSAFTFTASGDYGASPNTTATLKAIGNAQPGFNLALGDLSYNDIIPENNWCDYVKTNIGSAIPFELLTGNHEDYDPVGGSGGSIDSFSSCLPHKIDNITGVYPREYYFDYNNLARFIQISPNIMYEDGYWHYSQGDAHYNWLLNAIDTARSSGIKWVIVSMHENCIAAGEHACVLQDVHNLLVENKVDLILQGHDHTYQRSKQISLNSSTCPSMPSGSFNSNCVVDDGGDGFYTKGQGPVIVISGGGGRPLEALNMSDPEINYFSTWMDNQTPNAANGYSKFTVTETEISASYVPAISAKNTNSYYTDSFVIGSDAVRSPDPVPTPNIPTSPLPTSIPNSGTVTLPPIADTYNNSADPNANYGYGWYLYTNGTPTQNTFLKFDLTSLAGKTITGATYGFKTISDPQSASSDTIQARLVSTTNWSERYMTYNNTVPISTTILGSATNIPAGAWQSINLNPSLIQTKIGTLLSFAVTSTGTDNIIASTRETSDSPYLSVSYTGSSSTSTPSPTASPTPTPTPQPTTAPTQTPFATLNPSSQTFDALADTYINSASANTSYGNSNTLYIDNSPVNKAFFKFDLSALAGKTLTSAKLRVKTTSDSASSSTGSQNFKLVGDVLWSEAYMTYSNTVAISNTTLGTLSNAKSNTQYTIPLTLSAIQAKVGSRISIASDTTSKDELIINSREASQLDDRPKLIVTF